MQVGGVHVIGLAFSTVAASARAEPVSPESPPCGPRLVLEVGLHVGDRIVESEGYGNAGTHLEWQLGVDWQLPASRWKLGGAASFAASDRGSQYGVVARAGLWLHAEWSLRLGLGVVLNSSDLTAGLRNEFVSGLVRVGIESHAGFALDVDVQTNDTGGGYVRSSPALFFGITSTRPKVTLVTTGIGATIGLIALAVLLSQPMHE